MYQVSLANNFEGEVSYSLFVDTKSSLSLPPSSNINYHQLFDKLFSLSFSLISSLWEIPKLKNLLQWKFEEKEGEKEKEEEKEMSPLGVIVDTLFQTREEILIRK